MNGLLQYHIVWCTKYRRKVLVGDIVEDLKKELEAISQKNKWEIKEIEVMEDHIHVFVKADTVTSVHRIVSQFKGISSFKLRKKHLWLKTRLPCLWTRSYYADSIGNANSETIKKYIQNQKKERANSSQS